MGVLKVILILFDNRKPLCFMLPRWARCVPPLRFQQNLIKLSSRTMQFLGKLLTQIFMEKNSKMRERKKLHSKMFLFYLNFCWSEICLLVRFFGFVICERKLAAS